jgi:hypothetical protein
MNIIYYLLFIVYHHLGKKIRKDNRRTINIFDNKDVQVKKYI